MEKIVMISPYDVFPPHAGVERRIYHLAKEISRHKQVYFVYPLEKHEESEDIPHLIRVPYAIKSRYGRLFNINMISKTLKICRKENISFLYAQSFWGALQAIILKTMMRIPYVLDEHNVEYDRLRGTGNKLWQFFFIYELFALHLAHFITCVSEKDMETFKKLGIPSDRLYVANNGVDTSIFRPSKEARERVRKHLGAEDEPIILFFGVLDYPPSREAIQIIREHIIPKVIQAEPRARFVVAGRHPPCRTREDRLEFVGLVEKIEDYINASDVVICPIVSGGGTRIKILESIACGKKVVSTSMGANGLDAKILGEGLVIVDGWDSFSQAVIDTIREPKKPIAIQDGFLDTYSWRRIVDRLVIALDDFFQFRKETLA
ncbi:MAG: glycosyltransferase family 4 protein [Actinomycetota bacterium]|nr:glycosyltransferase family 4 protein [Actinomycetota bacterium]